MSYVLNAAAIAALSIGAGAATMKMMNDTGAVIEVPALDWQDMGALDGRVFRTEDTILETGEVLNDELRFKDGQFQSAMCQEYCDFGWSDYQTWSDGEVIHFTTTTRCPDAPHTVVWYGKVDGDEVTFEGTWMTRRWYWTHTLNVRGEGAERAASEQTSG